VEAGSSALSRLPGPVGQLLRGGCSVGGRGGAGGWHRSAPAAAQHTVSQSPSAAHGGCVHACMHMVRRHGAVAARQARQRVVGTAPFANTERHLARHLAGQGTNGPPNGLHRSLHTCASSSRPVRVSASLQPEPSPWLRGGRCSHCGTRHAVACSLLPALCAEGVARGCAAVTTQEGGACMKPTGTDHVASACMPAHRSPKE